MNIKHYKETAMHQTEYFALPFLMNGCELALKVFQTYENKTSDLMHQETAFSCMSYIVQCKVFSEETCPPFRSSTDGQYA